MIMFWTHHPRLSYRRTECYRMSVSYSFEHYFCIERFSHRFFMCTQTHACEWMRPHFRHIKSGYILCANYLQKSDVQCLAEWTQSVSVSAAHLCHLALTDSGTQASPGEIQLFSVNYWSKKSGQNAQETWDTFSILFLSQLVLHQRFVCLESRWQLEKRVHLQLSQWKTQCKGDNHLYAVDGLLVASRSLSPKWELAEASGKAGWTETMCAGTAYASVHTGERTHHCKHRQITD